MQFKFLTLVTAALSAASVQAFSAQDVVKNIQSITTLSAYTNDIATNLGPFNLFSSIPRIINNFRGIIVEVTSDIASMGNEKPTFKKEEQLEVCGVFTKFVEVHQALLKTIIGKGSLISRTPFTAPIAAVLRALESGVDTLAFGIIGLVPTCENKAQAELAKLQGSIKDAISTFSF